MEREERGGFWRAGIVGSQSLEGNRRPLGDSQVQASDLVHADDKESSNESEDSSD